MALGSFLASPSSPHLTAPVSGKVTVRARVLRELRQHGDPSRAHGRTVADLAAHLPAVSLKQVDNAIRGLRRAGLVTLGRPTLTAAGRHARTYLLVTGRPLDGAELIRRERERQVAKGYTDTHDDRKRRAGELADAAVCLLLELTQGPGLAVDGELGPPTTWVSRLALRMRGESRRKRLQVIGALVAAEIDREHRQ